MTASRPATAEPPRGVPESLSHSVWRSAVWTGGVAAVLAAALGICIAILCWLPDAGVSGHPLSAIRAGLLGFLAAQHGGLTVDGTPAGFVPLGMTALAGLVAWRAGTVLGEVAERAGSTGRDLARALVVQAATYGLGCAVIVPISTLGSSSAPLFAATGAGIVLFGCVSGVALARTSPTAWSRLLDLGRPVLGVLAVYVGSGALLAAGSVVLHAGRVSDLSRLVGGGVSGFPIVVLGILSTPNAAVAGAAYLSGPGFAVGSGTTFSVFSGSHGTVPAFPLLGALPTGNGANPLVLAWVALTLLVAGAVLAALSAAPSGSASLRSLLRGALLAGLAMGALAWLGGGGIGTGRLRAVGASPWQVTLAVGAEVAVVGLVLLAAQVLWRRLASGSPLDVPLAYDDAEREELQPLPVADSGRGDGGDRADRRERGDLDDDPGERAAS